jgi:putative endonuclease
MPDARRRSVVEAVSDGRQRLGRLGEDLAAEHLERRGFELVERNYRTRWGELDIVAFDGQTLAFCEVKTRRAGGGSPFESLHAHKRARVRKMAGQWLIDRSDRPYAPAMRFDAIGITVDRTGALVSLQHLEGAWH